MLGTGACRGREGEVASLQQRVTVALEGMVGAASQGKHGALEAAGAGVEEYCTHVGKVGAGRYGQVVWRLVGVV